MDKRIGQTDRYIRLLYYAHLCRSAEMVQPGDLVCGDPDGLLSVPAELVCSLTETRGGNPADAEYQAWEERPCLRRCLPSSRIRPLRPHLEMNRGPRVLVHRKRPLRERYARKPGDLQKSL